MPHMSHETSLALGKGIDDALAGGSYGYVCLVIDLSDGTLSMVSTAPSTEVLRATLENAVQSMSGAESFFLAKPTNPGELN